MRPVGAEIINQLSIITFAFLEVIFLKVYRCRYSSGKLSQILTEDLDDFHTEKDELLRAGLSVSKFIHTDDTGARHKGKNGYCTHMAMIFLPGLAVQKVKV